MSDTVIRQYLAGKSEPTRPAIVALAIALDVREQWLVTGEGPKRRGAGGGEGQGDVAPLDEELLQSVIATVEELLDQYGLELAPAKKGRLVTILYADQLKEGARQADRAKVIRLINLAA